MKESIWGYWIIVLGISVISVMVLLQNYTTTSEQDYYLVKNCLEASMYDAVDYGYYRDTGTLKMNQEKFQENFLRRFAQSVNISKDYEVDFYGIYEIPPAASVSVTTLTNESNFGNDAKSTESVDVTNRLTGILYTNENYTLNFNSKSNTNKDETTETFTGTKTSSNEYWNATFEKSIVKGCSATKTGEEYIFEEAKKYYQAQASSEAAKKRNELDKANTEKNAVYYETIYNIEHKYDNLTYEYTLPENKCCSQISCRIKVTAYDGKTNVGSTEILAEGFTRND